MGSKDTTTLQKVEEKFRELFRELTPERMKVVNQWCLDAGKKHNSEPANAAIFMADSAIPVDEKAQLCINIQKGIDSGDFAGAFGLHDDNGDSAPSAATKNPSGEAVGPTPIEPHEAAMPAKRTDAKAKPARADEPSTEADIALLSGLQGYINQQIHRGIKATLPEVVKVIIQEHRIGGSGLTDDELDARIAAIINTGQSKSRGAVSSVAGDAVRERFRTLAN